MDLKVVHEIYQQLVSDNLSLIYQGNFSDDVTAKILHLSENNIDNKGDLVKLKRKISFILVECFQNIIRHKEQFKDEEIAENSSGLFITRNIGNDYFITSANMLETQEVESLREKLKNINSLSKDDLKELYLRTLENSEISERGGAGIGLIEMARKSGNKLEFDFEEIDKKFSYFYLRIWISNELDPNPAIKQRQIAVPLTSAKCFRKDIYSNGIMMIYRGDFSSGAILPVLKMIEDNLHHKQESQSIQKKVFWILVEVLQNIAKHGLHEYSKEGIFLIGRNKDNTKYEISAGNLMPSTSVKAFERHLQMVNELDHLGLTKLYKATLREGKGTSRGGAGLGIIDIVRESGHKLQYDFKDFDEKSVFFSLNITI